ncbi:hypothetical protein [Niastella sp. OAS944]|uniref:hypothetical protein n=1 Tax=Niastella sp. OAS944 TaxID=2664089 RepID=UPI003483F9A5|nr:hypothetical protein [Chitinophagaceae bacterium OAS944]
MSAMQLIVDISVNYMTTTRIIATLFTVALTGCGLGAGTLGGFATITFPASKKKVIIAIDSLFAQYPEYKIPDKWKKRDDWKERGYNFLDSRIFYFKSEPEEMYYVSFYGDANDSLQVDTTKTGISIRAVDNGADYVWTKESDISTSEERRISERFQNEIVSKLEHYINAKAFYGQ